MTRVSLLASLLLCVLSSASGLAQSAQPAPYKVVFDLTSADPIDQRAVLRWIKEVSGVNPRTEMEVVMYARGLDLVVSGKSTMAADVADAMRTARVTFDVCAIAMKSQQVTKNDLLPDVHVVPDGIGEIVAKQRSGWGYIKVSH
jgi:intracellular sulfur oxidation DsrE/DsrF family protein